MQKGSNKHSDFEDPIYSELSLYKIITTKQNRKLILHMDGSVSSIIPFTGINNTSFNEEYYTAMFKKMQMAIDEIRDPNISIQFVMMRDNNVSTVHNIESLPTFLQPRAQYMENLAENYQLFVNRFYVGVHYANKKKKGVASLLDLAKQFIKKSDQIEDNYRKANEGLNDRVSGLAKAYDAMMELLSGAGAETTVLQTEQDFYNIIQKFTRPSKSKIQEIKIDQSVNQPVSPRKQLFSGVRANVRKSDFSLDDYYHKIWTLDRAPREVISGKTIEAIENVAFEFIYSVTFRLMEHKEVMNMFKYRLAERKIAEGSNEGAIIEDKSLTYETNRIDQNYTDFIEGQARGVSVSANFVIRVQESFILKIRNQHHISREDMIRKFDQDLIKKIFYDFGSSEWATEENTGWMVFNKIIPGMSNIHSGELKEMFLSTENIPYFFALYDNHRELKHNGTNHFVDIRGNRVIFDLMDGSLPAWNYSISGQTGSGKSVLMNAILTMQFAEMNKAGKGPVICILDVGGDRGSYSKFMTLVKGTQINLAGAVKPRIQMLEIVPERSLPTPEKIKQLALMIHEDHPQFEDLEETKVRVRSYYDEFLKEGGNNLNERDRNKLFLEAIGVDFKKEYKDAFNLKAGECEPSLKNFTLIMSLLEIFLSPDPKNISFTSSGYEADEIGYFVRETYRRKTDGFPFMTDLVATTEQIIREKSNGELTSGASKLLIKLKEWTREGTYPMFDMPSNINIENDVILADLKGLESDVKLQMVYTMLISETFNNKMYFTKDRRKLMVRDEAWSLMKNAKARQYFIEDLRTARKNGFATIAISQLPTDYLKPDPDDGRAIMSNMQVNIFCRFESTAICRAIGEEYRLSEEIVDEMTKLGVQKVRQADGSVRASYATFMMVMGKSVYILKNLLHPFEYMLYSSSAEDNAIIDFYMKKQRRFDNLEDTLWFIARKLHIGDTDLADFLEEGGYSNKALEVRGKKER